MDSYPRPVVRPWKLFFSAKTKDFSADLNVQHRPHRSLLSFLPSKQHTSNDPSVSISLRIRIHNLILRIRIAAGKMKEMKLLQRFHRFRKVTVLDVKPSEHTNKNCTAISAVPFCPFPHILYNSPKWKGNGFVYGSICVGTFVYLVSRRCASFLHFPVFCLMRAGTSIAGLIAKNKKSASFVNSSSSLSARIWQGIKKTATLSRVNTKIPLLVHHQRDKKIHYDFCVSFSTSSTSRSSKQEKEEPLSTFSVFSSSYTSER